MSTLIFLKRISFDDWRSLKNLISENGLAYKFDLRKGYYHVEITEAHQTYLGFSWNLDGREKFFIFCVLPFGLSSAPMLFTKLLRSLVSYWHDHGIKICVFLDDGGGTESNLVKAISSSNFVKRSLKSSGFVVNQEKSVWHPQKRLTWLGVIIDFSENAYFITEKRIETLIDLIIKTLTMNELRLELCQK
uniref:Reverse transcriptase domain-containing protein n=1 Tax=Clytia hemisphaerica TaxID=252671 RepID=A0A7M5V2U7_9CNID